MIGVSAKQTSKTYSEFLNITQILAVHCAICNISCITLGILRLTHYFAESLSNIRIKWHVTASLWFNILCKTIDDLTEPQIRSGSTMHFRFCRNNLVLMDRKALSSYYEQSNIFYIFCPFILYIVQP